MRRASHQESWLSGRKHHPAKVESLELGTVGSNPTGSALFVAAPPARSHQAGGVRHCGIRPLFTPSSPGTDRQPVQSLAMTRIRLFHFDIPTWGNYGDKALFPVVRDLFTGFGGGQAFEFAGAAPLRREVGFELVERINATADAVVVGGGGLFLQDTNPNANSGWQWNISRAALDRLEVPIIVFAVGDN